jgi:aerobic-type carbon monoxide dehydrogenase small subunit (CoxS/CutS family)
MKRRIRVEINGRLHEGELEPRTLLSDWIRAEGLTGTNVGCEHGVCGACTVQLDEEPVRSCLMLAVQADGRSVRTVEALAHGDDLHPLQRAFQETHALQCGFCTPGFLMSLDVFLRRCPDPSEDEIRAALAGNLCRCTGYVAMVEAVRVAARTLGPVRVRS